MKTFSFPDGPSTSAADQTFQWFSRPYALLEDCFQKFGDVFLLNFQDLGPHVFVCRPSLVKEIFTGDADLFLGGQGKEMLRPFLGDSSMLLTDGPKYQEHRKRVLPLLRAPATDPWAGQLPKQISAFLKQRMDRELAVHEFCVEISLELILTALFSEGSRAELAWLVTDFMQGVSFNAHSAFQQGVSGKAVEKLKADLEKINLVLFSELERLRKNPVPGSLVSQLIESADEAGWSDQEIRDEVMTLLIAGHETTASSLSWTLFEVAKSEPTQTSLSSIKAASDPFVDAVLKEGMRLWPVIPVVARKLAKDHTIGEFSLPAGAHVVPCLYLAHRNPEVYDKPSEFLPERFLNRNFPGFEYFPFGGGIRRCSGMSLALLEMGAVIHQLFTESRPTFSGMEKVRPSRRSVAIVPSGPFRIKLNSR